jgi:hypothetical protein
MLKGEVMTSNANDTINARYTGETRQPDIPSAKPDAIDSAQPAATVSHFGIK